MVSGRGGWAHWPCARISSSICPSVSVGVGVGVGNGAGVDGCWKWKAMKAIKVPFEVISNLGLWPIRRMQNRARHERGYAVIPPICLICWSAQTPCWPSLILQSFAYRRIKHKFGNWLIYFPQPIAAHARQRIPQKSSSSSSFHPRMNIISESEILITIMLNM